MGAYKNWFKYITYHGKFIRLIQYQHTRNFKTPFNTNTAFHKFQNTFFQFRKKYSQIFNNIKHNFDIHAENNSIISYLVSTNKSLKKKSKKDVLRYKNKVKKIIECKTFKSIVFLDHFKYWYNKLNIEKCYIT